VIEKLRGTSSSSFNVPTPRCSWVRIAFMRALRPSIGFSRNVALLAPFIANIRVSNHFQWLAKTMSRLAEPSLMGKRNGHSRVAIWAKCQRMDMLLTQVPHFRVPTEGGIGHREQHRTSTEPYTQHELLCSSFAAGPKLGIRSNKRVSVIWEPRSSKVAMFRGSRRAYCRNDNLMLWQAKDCVVR
jgi:hypothetical protein